ncbi:glycosyl hydrolase 2 galactose-binding domain-containing protein, partial [Agromyces soli]
GVVHLDLLAAGLIPDPYLDDNDSRLAWIGLVVWTYATTFDLAETELLVGRRHALVFDGLDTVASVTLNGLVIAEVANQHRTHRIVGVGGGGGRWPAHLGGSVLRPSSGCTGAPMGYTGGSSYVRATICTPLRTPIRAIPEGTASTATRPNMFNGRLKIMANTPALSVP